jgi:hypothetical protein
MSEEMAAPAPPEPPDKAALLRLIDETRATYEAALGAIPDQQAPLRDDGWSARDIAGHVAVWERRLAHDIRTSLRGETPERPEPGYTWEQMDELNVRDMLAARSLPLAEAQAEARAAFAETRALVASLSDETLFTPGLFDWTEGERLALWVRYDMWEHYQEHTVDLTEWTA